MPVWSPGDLAVAPWLTVNRRAGTDLGALLEDQLRPALGQSGSPPGAEVTEFLAQGWVGPLPTVLPSIRTWATDSAVNAWTSDDSHLGVAAAEPPPRAHHVAMPPAGDPVGRPALVDLRP